MTGCLGPGAGMEEEHEETSKGGWSIHYLDWDHGFKDVYASSDISNFYVLKIWAYFILIIIKLLNSN